MLLPSNEHIPVAANKSCSMAGGTLLSTVATFGQSDVSSDLMRFDQQRVFTKYGSDGSRNQVAGTDISS
jgi:hypothetical protein